MVVKILMSALLFTAPADLLDQVQVNLTGLAGFEAEFSQAFVDSIRGKRIEEKGKFWASKDRKVRWEYRSPTQKLFVFDGNHAYFYEPKSHQVTVFEEFSQSTLVHIFDLLVGSAGLEKHFRAQLCEKDCAQLAAPGSNVLEMIPNKVIPNVQRILAKVDSTRKLLSDVWVMDPLGNRTEYSFRDLKASGKLETSFFSFEIPKGVSVLKADTTQR